MPIIIIKLEMQVYLCTFEILLGTVKIPQETKLADIEAVLRSEKGEVIIVGAMKPIPKRGTAIFNEAFEIKTDLLRDPQTQLYHSNTIVLEIRKANQSLHTKVSPSICRFNLAEVINLGPMPQKFYSAEDSSFTASLSIKCNSIEDTGKRRPLRKKSQKRLPSNDSAGQKQINHQEIHRDRRRSIEGNSRSSSRESKEKQKGKRQTESYQKELNDLKAELQKEQIEHVLTQERLRQNELSLAEHENLVNHLSALVNQRETDVVELTNRMTCIQDDMNRLEERNSEITDFINEKEQFQMHRDVLKIRIVQLENALQASNQIYNSLVKSESQLQKNLQKQEEKNRQLKKAQQAMRKDLLGVQMEKESLMADLKKSTSEKNSLKESVKMWRQEIDQRTKSKEKEYEVLRQEFVRLQLRLKENEQVNRQKGEMVWKSQLVAVEQYYEQKIIQYQEKENSLKEQIDVIEQEMSNLEDLLEEKEENQLILIDHAKKLQNDLENVNNQSNWWLKILTKQLESPTFNGRLRETIQNDLRQRNRKLLKILQDSSKQILESEKNKRESARLEKYIEDFQVRFLQMSDQLKEVKERLAIMMKENKKLLQKNSRITKQFDGLKRTSRKMAHELTSVKAQESEVRQKNESLNVEKSLLEHQINKLKEQIEENHKDESKDTRTVWKRKKEDLGIPMPLIHEISEEMMISIPLQSIQGSEKQIEKEVPESVTARQISTLLDKRGTMLDDLLTQISKASEEREFSGEPIRRELKKIKDLTTRFKLTLMRAGQKQGVKDWQTSLRCLSEEVDRLLLSR